MIWPFISTAMRYSLADKSVGEKMLEELKELETKADELEKEIRKAMSERGGI